MRAFYAMIAGSAIAAIATISSPAHAEDCTAPGAVDELNPEQVQVIYDCIREELRAGYKAGDDPVAVAYTDWGAASKLPAAPGFHSNRFLMTFVNETGFDAYTDFKDEDALMPVGTVIAKESFGINKKKVVRKGPLLIMEKVAVGTADEFDNWVYSGVTSKGKVMKIKQAFCHDCHVGFEAQDNLGYPVEEVRVSK